MWGEFLQLTENALTLLKLRYLRRNEYGEIIETPEELFKRVAHAIASVEKKYGKSDQEIEKIEKEFFELLTSLKFLPNSPTLMNAGTGSGQLSACNVLPLDDSMESIFETIKNAAIVQKFGGGTGFSFSRLRPKGDKVGSTGGIAAGPIFFLNAFDSALKGIRQAHRRFATNMGVLRVDHPDIFEFIDSKKQEGTITTFNISVGITDKFMKAVKENGKFELVNPRNNQVVEVLPAMKIFDKIAEAAWRNGEPGLIFLDRMNNTESNPVPKFGPIETTNPCGEQPLYPYDSCNLGSIDVSKMIKNSEIDWVELKRVIHLSVRFLDNVIDASLFPLKEIEERTKSIRRIGLGIMGFADMLIKLEIPYNSDKALEIAEKLMKFITEEGRKASVKLAEERGSFPEFENSIWKERGYKCLRNATITTIAPTSNLSIIAGCSHSIEPLFSITYVRNVKDSLGTNLIETNPLFEKVAREKGFYSEELMKKILKKGKLSEVKEVPENIRKIFVVAHEISPEWHVKMQAAFQKYTDNAVSKTVNLPNKATVEDVKKIYMLAYDLGCKGITVYRDGSREHQIINIPAEKTEEDEAQEIIESTGGCATCHL
ncbi:MAG: adenosylcobalamin-dependent ribonucleoside-diphosphate reductase [Candidatus Aenigmarchaeota archaeon]|nr:adenosylcobalamin-dependent ribonucleoside-diphosphate reductase [Candidatus Aenigmarchaeota archaeon]MBU5689081.1 adenosylcobalamin-dependent ribonucleoside-diphosphate reductase [Candidatus Aenigmarchaeota archaeon]